jgi:hypothetical protein
LLAAKSDFRVAGIKRRGIDKPIYGLILMNVGDLRLGVPYMNIPNTLLTQVANILAVFFVRTANRKTRLLGY